MSRVTALLLSLGPAKLLRRNLICIRRQYPFLGHRRGDHPSNVLPGLADFPAKRVAELAPLASVLPFGHSRHATQQFIEHERPVTQRRFEPAHRGHQSYFIKAIYETARADSEGSPNEIYQI